MEKIKLILAIVSAVLLMIFAGLLGVARPADSEYRITEQHVVTKRVEPYYTGAVIFVTDENGEEYEFTSRTGANNHVVNCCDVGIEYIMVTAWVYLSEYDKWFVVERKIIDDWAQDRRAGDGR